MKEILKIAIDCDDAAIELKKDLYDYLIAKGYDITDLSYSNGTNTYPEIGYNLSKKIQSGEFNRGIILCGTGLGMSIIANKVKGIYAGVCHDVYSAIRLRKSNNANVITLGARVVGPELAKLIVDAFLESEFSRGSSLRKVEKLKVLESECYDPNKD